MNDDFTNLGSIVLKYLPFSEKNEILISMQNLCYVVGFFNCVFYSNSL